MKKMLVLSFCAIIAQGSFIFSSAFDIHQPGTIRTVTGPMKADKTGTLIRYAQLLNIAGIKPFVTKPDIDNRKLTLLTDDPTRILSSRGTKNTFPCIPVGSVDELIVKIERENPSHVIVDEINFFKEKAAFVALVRELARQGKQVILGGLNLDCFEETFEPMGTILPLTNYTETLTAICDICKNSKACRSQRLHNGLPAKKGDPVIIVEGSTDTVVYQSRCLLCYEKPQ